jgi:SAM-dependent methyltransferase
VACTTNDAVCKDFSLGKLSLTPICQRAVRSLLVDLTIQQLQRNMPAQPSSPPQVTPERLMQFAFAYAPPLIIGAAVTSKVFDTLASGPKTLEEVTVETGASPRGLRAIMNALVGLQLLGKKADRYELTRESEAFLVSNKSGSLAGMFAINRTHLIPDWLNLPEAVKTGTPAVALNDESRGPEFFSVLVENIIPMSYPAATALGRSLGLIQAETPVRVLDIAAGSGIWGIALAQQSPLVQVTAQDWPEVVPTTKRIVAKFGMTDRFRFVEGDVLSADFGEGHDVATLGHILHTEGEKRSRKLLRKTFAALKPGGTIAIGEWLVNDDRTQPINALVFGVNMLLHSEHGDTFSFNEIKSWLEDAGFTKIRALDAPGPSPLVVANKP